MVRLKGHALIGGTVKQNGFNSTMVRLKEVHRIEVRPSFNSTMVRLKVFDVEVARFAISEFQFHNGSIKSNVSIPHLDKITLSFQFHNGSIKSGPES